MELVSRFKRGREYAQYFARGFVEEQAVSTFGSAPFRIARKRNPDFGKPKCSIWEDRGFMRNNDAELRGFIAGELVDLALFVTAFAPIAGDNPRAARYALGALGVKLAGQAIGLAYNFVDNYIHSRRLAQAG